MNTIYKTQLNPPYVGRHELNLPVPAIVVGAGIDPTGRLSIWHEADNLPGAPTELTVIEVTFTGEEIPDWDGMDTKLQYVQLVTNGPLVYHVWEEKPV